MQENSSVVLKDLGEMIKEAKTKVDNFDSSDFKLSESFKKAFRKVSEHQVSVKFQESTAIVTINKSGQKIYVPNQWFLLATYTASVTGEIIKYRELVEKCIENRLSDIRNIDPLKLNDRKEIYKTLREQHDEVIDINIEKIFFEELKHEGFFEDIAKNNSKLLVKFLTNENWWLGSKGAERQHDYYVPTILSILNLVNVSSNFVASISYYYAVNKNLHELLENIKFFSSDLSEFSSLDDDKKDIERYNTENFKNWLLNPKNNEGKSYSPKTIDDYISYVNTTKLSPNKSLFYSTDIKIVTDVCNDCLEQKKKSAIFKYLNYLKSLNHNSDDINTDNLPINSNFHLNFIVGVDYKFSRNRILFGAPGTGKSHRISKNCEELLGTNNEAYYERVTFHPDYSYANFVGTYKPVMVKKTTHHTTNQTSDLIKRFLEGLIDRESKQNNLNTTCNSLKRNNEETTFNVSNESLDGGESTQSLLNNKLGDNDPSYKDENSLKLTEQQVNDNSLATSEISYEYVPGPFMRMYVKALRNAQNVQNGTEDPKPYLLIIEEINRANVAAVFGDIFQLLDRDEHNVSEYPIQASEDIKQYLAKELGGQPDDYSKIRIPDNLFIWATMNSADQGVFPMDTAFKRRWDFTYLGIDDNDENIRNKYFYLDSNNTKKVEWNSLRKAINNYLAKQGINEDKQLGPYFISNKILGKTDEIDSKKFIGVFKSKVIMYLFDDAAKQKRSSLFSGVEKEDLRYSKICEAFDKKGLGIFNKDIQDKYDKYDKYVLENDSENNVNSDIEKDEINDNSLEE